MKRFRMVVLAALAVALMLPAAGVSKQQAGTLNLIAWQGYTEKQWVTPFQKAMWSTAATAENQFAYDYLPKLDVTYDVLRAFELMHQGRMNGSD